MAAFRRVLRPLTASGRPFARAIAAVQQQRNVQWVFLGCPGVGKGTYASRLSHLMGVPHIATGDLVRDELAQSGPLAHQLEGIVNQAKLVSDETIISLLSQRLENGQARGESGFILDGFPRTIKQAPLLEPPTASPSSSHCPLSQPVKDFYRARGKLLEFHLPGGIPESWPKLLEVLNLEDHDNKQSAAA
ncbi:unnamed protein product [Victoria cruziana]